LIFSGQQNNNAYLQNPYFKNAQIDSRQQTSNSAILNQAKFETATINGRKRNAIHVKSIFYGFLNIFIYLSQHIEIFF